MEGADAAAGAGIPTVQSCLRQALIRVVRHDVTVVGSSRTDAGVHAKGQVCHFDTDKSQIPVESLRRSANYQLPDDILIRSVEPVGRRFDAIASTVAKRYQYAIWNDVDRSPMGAGLAWHRWQTLDVDAMDAAAKFFQGTHDFTTFCRPGHGRVTTVRTVTGATSAAARRGWSSASRGRGSCGTWCGSWSARWSRSAWAGTGPRRWPT